MREIMLVTRREFRERVHTKAFLIGTILFPIFVAGVMILPTLSSDKGELRTLAVVDHAPEGIADRFANVLGAVPADEKANRYKLELIRRPVGDVQKELNARVQSEKLDGIVILPANVLESNEILYRSSTAASIGLLRDLGAAASQAVQAEKLRRAGLDVTEVTSLVARVQVNNARITASGEEKGDTQSTFWVAYLIAFAIYFVVAIYGVGVMRSVLEEKTNRISEVLVSSVRSSHLMFGKIVGVASAAILQVLIWAAAMTLLMTQTDWVADRLGIPPEAIKAAGMEPGVALLLFGYFVLGFFLFAALFAALGAAVTSEQEAQSFQMFLMVPLFLPLLFLLQIATEPLGSIATTLGLIPFTAPVAMPMRMAAAPIPREQIVASLALLAAAMILVAWIAGKIYRIGILATGSRPSVRELIHWLRTA